MSTCVHCSACLSPLPADVPDTSHSPDNVALAVMASIIKAQFAFVLIMCSVIKTVYVWTRPLCTMASVWSLASFQSCVR